AGVRAGLAAPAPARRPARRMALRGAVVGALAAAAAVLVVGRVRGGDDGGEEAGFRAKGGAPAAGDTDRWIGVHLYHEGEGGRMEKVGDRLPRGGVMVSYTNLGPTPYDYLMVFEVNARGDARWYYPAYMSIGTRPQAIAIERGAVDVALPELIEHDDLPGGPVVVCGLFLRRPLAVTQLEAALAASPGLDLTRARLPISDAGQHCMALEREAP
ncbi:MAG TPA: hypothetical protein VMZ28_03500, partial [Kofleriaceae bacterium]|nr:hypothetical protein [Kofleriaceae bacterium]